MTGSAPPAASGNEPVPPPPSDWFLPSTLAEVMEVADWGREGRFVVFRGELKLPPADAARELRRRLERFGMLPFFSREDGGIVIRCTPARRRKEIRRRALPFFLFLATVVSTLIVGALMSGIPGGALLARPGRLIKGAPFSFTLLVILACHEFSHYFVSRRHGIRTSLPYFIPFPNLLGTMGAVIISRSPFTDRKSLFDVGIAGPLASFFLSLGAIILGFSGTTIAPVPVPLDPGPSIQLGNSLLISALFSLRFGPLPAGSDFFLGPVGFAGWVGLFVTALNLLPMGQLDGGHISYALFGRRHDLISRGVMLALAVFGLLASSPLWIFIALLVAVFGPRHGPPLDDITPLNPARRWLAVLAFLILAVCFIPVPLRII